MRIASTLVLALAAAIAALALSASTGSAATGIEFSNEDTSEHCLFIGGGVGGTCEVDAHSESETLITAHVFGFEIDQSRCLDELTGYVGETGEGHIVNQSILPGPSNTCTKKNCAGSESEWPFQMEEDGPGLETMLVRFCLENLDGTGARHCTITVQANLNHHTGEFRAVDRECQEGLAEVTGHWLLEQNNSDEIVDIH